VVSGAAAHGGAALHGGALHGGGLHGGGHGSPWMVPAHGAAVVVTGVLLARGERLLEACARRLRAVPRLLPAVHRRPLPVAPGPARPAAPADRHPYPMLPALRAAEPVVRRGPPLRAC
jgi:hypothetical protein